MWSVLGKNFINILFKFNQIIFDVYILPPKENAFSRLYSIEVKNNIRNSGFDMTVYFQDRATE